MALNDTIRVRVWTRAGNQLGMSVLHYKQFTQIGVDITPSAFLTVWESFMVAPWKACMSVNAEYRGETHQRIFPTPPTPQVSSIANAGPGTSAGDLLPREVSSILTLRTAFAGRRYRGRIYVAFPSEGANDNNGIMVPGQVTNLTNLAAALLAPITVTVGPNSSQYKLVVYHRNDHTTTDVTSIDARPYWASQRRRGDYGATNLSI